jgi:hypothetical protein
MFSGPHIRNVTGKVRSDSLAKVKSRVASCLSIPLKSYVNAWVITPDAQEGAELAENSHAEAIFLALRTQCTASNFDSHCTAEDLCGIFLRKFLAQRRS